MILERLLEERLNSPRGERERESEREGPEGNEEALLPRGVRGRGARMKTEAAEESGGGERRRRRRSKTRGRGERGGSRN